MADDSTDLERDKSISRMCIASTIIVFLSVICVIVGGLAISKSAPDYTFPYCLGGALIAGITSIISSCCNMCVYCEYKGMVRDSIESWVCWMSVVISFLMISLILGAGISGIWGMTQTTDRIKVEQTLRRNSYDIAYEKANLNYAIASFVLVLILIVLHTIVWCYCCSFLNTYGFGDRSYTQNQIRQTLRRLEQLDRENPYATRANRSRGVAYSIPIPEIYHGTVPQPSAPDEESSNYISSVPSPSSSTGNGSNRSPEVPRADRLPPPYEELGGGLPTYQEVVTGGRYISTGNTEFVTKI